LQFEGSERIYSFINEIKKKEEEEGNIMHEVGAWWVLEELI